MLDNKEVELTFQLSENNWKVVENWLKKNSIFSGKSRIVDYHIVEKSPLECLITNNAKNCR